MYRFLSYHNAVPVALSIVVLSSSAAFAANSETVYSAETEVVTADNTYIAGKDLASYTPRLEIVSVTEDDENYYVAYQLYTIDIVEYVWRDVVKEKVLTVARGQLKEHDDLGLFATEQLKQVVDYELQYLSEVQQHARKQVTQKTVATVYGGLVGKFLDTTTEELPGYVPVVTPPPPPLAAVPVQSTSGAQVAGAAAAGQTATPSSAVSGEALILQMLGQNPARHPIGAEPYADPGVVVTGGSGSISVKKFLNGKPVEHVVISATYSGEWTLRYEATDAAGTTMSAERLVQIYDPAAEPPPTPPAPVSEPEPESGTTPEPEKTEAEQLPQETATTSSEVTETADEPAPSGTEQTEPEPAEQGTTTPAQ